MWINRETQVRYVCVHAGNVILNDFVACSNSRVAVLRGMLAAW